MAVTDLNHAEPSALESVRLGCGRDLDELWDALDRTPNAHERDCPDCRQARHDLAPLVDATAELRQAELKDAALRPRPQLAASIMAVARAEVRRGRQLPLRHELEDEAPIEQLTISEQTVGQLVRRTGDLMDGIQVRRVHVRIDPSGDEPADLRASRVIIAMTMSVSVRVSAPAAVQQLREQVITEVAEATGLVVTRVDATVEDVHDA